MAKRAHAHTSKVSPRTRWRRLQARKVTEVIEDAARAVR